MKATQKEAIETLREILKPGDRVYTILRHVSRSGMMRHISLVIKSDANGIRDISHLAAKALDYKRADNGGIKTSGCGMDMGFDLVYNLSMVLFCPEGKYTHEGAYALKHEWL